MELPKVSFHSSLIDKRPENCWLLLLVLLSTLSAVSQLACAFPNKAFRFVGF